MTHNHDSTGDDELIARLKAAAGPERPVDADPYLYLPIAHEERVPGDQTCPDVAARCNASARRPLAVPGYFDVPATEPVSCELRAGHPGAHSGGFTRTRVRRRWHAFTWPEQASGTGAD